MSTSCPSPTSPTGNSTAASIMSAFVLALLQDSARNPSPSQNVDKNKEYDFVIVGAGSAGCVLARRLAELPGTTVLLLEAGREQPKETDVPSFMHLLQASNLDWGYKSQPQNNGPCATGCPLGRGKVLGGSSSINGLLYVRGNPLDYDLWNTSGWSYENVLPYFKKSENNGNPAIANDTVYHSTGGLLDVNWLPYEDPNVDVILEALDESGFPLVDVNGPFQLGRALHQTTSRNGRRRSTNRAFLETYTGNNLHVRTRAHVLKVVIDPKTKEALGVEYLDEQTGERTVVRCGKEVILCAGAYNSPQLLMLSGVGPRSHLDHHNIPVISDLPVGQNLKDHTGTFTGVPYQLSDPVNETADLSTRLGSYIEYLTSSSGPATSIGLFVAGAFCRSRLQDPDDPRPDLQFVFISQPDPSYYNTIAVLPVVLHPKSRGEILLNSTDPLDHPLFFNNVFQDERDLEVLVEGMKKATEFGNTEAFRKRGLKFVAPTLEPCQQFPENSLEFLTCVARFTGTPFWHAVGTCAIGSVVNKNLQVHGVQRLRVVDASVIPDTPSGNTNAPVIMVAERAADLIKNSWVRP